MKLTARFREYLSLVAFIAMAIASVLMARLCYVSAGGEWMAPAPGRLPRPM